MPPCFHILVYIYKSHSAILLSAAAAAITSRVKGDGEIYQLGHSVSSRAGGILSACQGLGDSRRMLLNSISICLCICV